MLEVIMNIMNNFGIPILTVVINGIVLVVSIAISIKLYKNKEITE
jgi:cell division protein FtsX